MNIVETEMDVYEIARNLFNNNNFNYNHYTIHNTDLKNYFEMLIIILTEGLKLFYGVNGVVYLDSLSIEQFNKLKLYFKKINIDLVLNIASKKEWINNKLNEKYLSYDKLIINYNTKLDELYFILNPNSNYIYIVNFKFCYN